MTSAARAEVSRIREALSRAARAGDAAVLERAIDEALSQLHNQVVAAHIAIVRRYCAADAELGVHIANALCDAGAGRLQRWALWTRLEDAD